MIRSIPSYLWLAPCSDASIWCHHSMSGACSKGLRDMNYIRLDILPDFIMMRLISATACKVLIRPYLAISQTRY